MFTTTPSLAGAMVALMAVLFVMSLVERNPFFAFYTTAGLGVALHLWHSARLDARGRVRPKR